MKIILNSALLLGVLLGVSIKEAPAQSAALRRPFIRSLGEGSVSVQPDLAKVNIGVVTIAATAQDASTQNAAKVAAVLGQLRQVLGVAGDIRTISYSVNANYTYPNGAPPVLVNYTASNTVEVTTTDLANIGKVIDAGAQAGANTIQGLQFSLKDEQPARSQALKLATQQARAHADAIAAGVNGRTGAVLAAEEGGSVSITPVRSLAPAATPTPVLPGTVEVRGNVTLEVELIQ